MNIRFRVLLLLQISLLGFLGSSCSTAPLPRVISHEEMIRRDQALGIELAQSFETHLLFKQDTEVSVYIRKVAQSLIDNTPELQGASVGIWLVRELVRDKDKKWSSFGLPGNRIYLPVGLLKRLDYENELAAAIAFQLGHLLEKHLHFKLITQTDSSKLHAIENLDDSMDRLWPLQDQRGFSNIHYFGPNGVFSYSDEDEAAAAQIAVRILYRAGYDPRGVISLFERYRNNIKQSPYETSTIMKMTEHARQEIAMFAPLRNPIVRSQNFLVLQKRIRKL